jgi:hypothetical protein
MVECKHCKFCDTKWANDGYGFCKIRFPNWLTQNSNSMFSVDKMVCIKPDCDDGCDLGQLLAEGETVDFPPTQAGYL